MIQGYDYSKAMCEVDCLLEITLEKCGCVGDQFKDFLSKNFLNIEHLNGSILFILSKDSVLIYRLITDANLVANDKILVFRTCKQICFL